jgi:hypothetical protein
MVATIAIGLIGTFAWSWLTSDSGANGTGALPKIVPAESEKIEPHAIDPLLEFAKKALRHHVENHHDFTAVMTKRERVGNKLEQPSKMAMKLRYGPLNEGSKGTSPNASIASRPISVYLKTIEPKAQAGREVIWVQGRNDNKLTAHEAGLLGMVSLDLSPDSRLAMNGNRYPITEIGIEKLLRKLIEKGERDRTLGPATVRSTENVEMAGRQCRLLEVIHESRSASWRGKTVEFEFHLVQIYIDDERLVPLKFASYSWPKTEGGTPELLEEYTYEELEFNVGLSDSDFDTKNTKYRF